MSGQWHEFFLDTIGPPPGRRQWHGGSSAVGVLRGIDVELALWSPWKGQRCIWELALHIAYWKYIVRKQLDDGAEDGFARSPSDWPHVPDPADDAAWKADRKLLRDEHGKLRDAIAALPARRFHTVPRKSFTCASLIAGSALHDAYHAAQIKMIKAAARQR